METFENQCAQGDLFIRRIDMLPDGLTTMPEEDGKYILGHSETGHHHAVEARSDIHAYQAANDPFVLYLVVKNEPVALTHLRGFDTHKPIQIGPGNYEIRRQREWTPEGWRRAAD